MSEEQTDVQWALGVARDLLDKARSAEAPDYAACAKMLDLCLKHLPKRKDSEDKSFGDLAREALEAEEAAEDQNSPPSGTPQNS